MKSYFRKVFSVLSKTLRYMELSYRRTTAFWTLLHNLMNIWSDPWQAFILNFRTYVYKHNRNKRKVGHSQDLKHVSMYTSKKGHQVLCASSRGKLSCLYAKNKCEEN